MPLVSNRLEPLRLALRLGANTDSARISTRDRPDVTELPLTELDMLGSRMSLGRAVISTFLKPEGGPAKRRLLRQ
jgi:hypothetical protein